MRIYVASSWRNQQQPAVVAALRKAGHEVYDFRNPRPGDDGFSWRQLDGGWEAWSAETYRGILLTHPRAAQGFMADFRAMQWADACVIVQPCGRSAHLEAGWFCGAGKRCVFLLDGEPDLMPLMASDICLSLDEVVAALG